ncbi:MAG TPA: glycoside hydrolase family 2 protein [Steroidobacteraceae bacterium]|nr:glycoside hydrolase family 2 protein [Steroidobacteraceae bacterium]
MGIRIAMVLATVAALAAPVTHGHDATERLQLARGWTLQSSARVRDSGETISTAGYAASGWLTAEVPTTVVAAQVRQGLLPDPFYAMNLRKFPGVEYPIGSNFSEREMPSGSPYAASWWYRTEFTLPQDYAGKTVWLDFRGINYRANVYLNGRPLADSEHIVGAWRTYELDATRAVKPGRNVLAVQVWAQTATDLGITFVDWNPAPPDKNMGLFREAYLTTSGPVALRHPAVSSTLDAPGYDTAHLTVAALLKNSSDHAVTGTLRGRIEQAEFAQVVHLAPGEQKDVTFDPTDHPQLNLRHPRLWWPAQMGKPELYGLDLRFEIDGKASDESHTSFGIREITSEVLQDSPGRFKRLFRVNGRKLLIRGAGWTPDMMLREDPQRMADEFRYVQDMGLNTVRLEGKLEPDEFFDMADRLGVLVMAGWCCCDFWEQWDKWNARHLEIAQASLRDQIYRLRNHPSLLVWLNGSDNPPPPNVEQSYLKIESELHWPNPVSSSATAKPTTVSGESGGKMSGPYEYVAPSYWTTDVGRPPKEQTCNEGGCGGAYGFNTETSMGPAVPVIESVRRMIPKEHLWPIDEVWNYHAGGGEFGNLHVFTNALEKRYGASASAEDYTFKAQAAAYEGVRAMYEAYSRNKYHSTGVIQWMLDNAWPSMIWHLYDYYLQPGGGYFGAKKAMQPLDPVYGYDDHSVWLVSSQYIDAAGLRVSARILDADATVRYSKDVTVDAAADSTAKVLELPSLEGLSQAYFLDLRVFDAGGALVGSNFYWLSTAPETLDWPKSTWWTTPTKSFADFTSLARLPKVNLQARSHTSQAGGQSITRVEVTNPSKSVAFFVRLKLTKGPGGDEVLPVVWQDNYISLLPGERRELTATYRSADLGAAPPHVDVQGWNVDAGTAN